MSKIVVTNKGRLLQNEIFQEMQNDPFTIRKKDTASHDSISEQPIPIKVSKRKPEPKPYEGGILGHLTINETIKKELAPLEDEEPGNGINLEENIVNNKFLQAKVAKLNNVLIRSAPTSRKSAETSILTLPKIGTGTDKHFVFPDAHNVSINSKAGSLGIEGIDRFGVDQYPKILHYESSISRLIERHIDNKKKILRTAKQVLENYDRKIKSLTDQNHKPPTFLDSLKEKNPEAVEVLLRNTRSHFRKMKRIDYYHQHKYAPIQVKYNDMNTKRFQNQLSSVQQRKIGTDRPY